MKLWWQCSSNLLSRQWGNRVSKRTVRKATKLPSVAGATWVEWLAQEIMTSPRSCHSVWWLWPPWVKLCQKLAILSVASYFKDIYHCIYLAIIIKSSLYIFAGSLFYSVVMGRTVIEISQSTLAIQWQSYALGNSWPKPKY